MAEDQYDEEYDQDDLDEQESQEQEELAQEVDANVKAEKKLGKNRLDELQKKVITKLIPVFSLREKMILNRYRKQYPMKVQMIKNLMRMKRQALGHGLRTVAGVLIPILPLVLIFLLVLLFIAAIITFIFGDGSSNGNMSSQLGVSGEYFYGTRVIYRDNDKANIDSVQGYVQIIADTIDKIESTDNGEINITIDVPSDDYDWSSFDESKFSVDYLSLYNLTRNIAKIVHDEDMLDETIIPTTLIEYVSNTEHFGYSLNLVDTIKQTISDYIIDNNFYSYTNQEETSPEQPDTNVDVQEIIDISASEIVPKYAVQAEKLYVKDYIFVDTDDRMENISTEDYVAMIFMPKQNINFNYFSFIVKDVNVDSFNIYVTNGVTDVNLTGEQFTTENDSGYVSWMYESSDNLNLSQSIFTDIDQNNFDFLSNGMSIYDIAMSGESASIYLEEKIDEITGKNYYSIKQNGVKVAFSSTNEFCFAEFETQVE